MVAYPSTLPLECVMTVTTIIRERKVAERKAQFGHCFWNVQGFVQKTLLGEDADHATGFGTIAAEVKPEQMQAMADALEDFRTENGYYGSTADNETDIAGLVIIMQIIPILIAAMKQLGWIKKKSAGDVMVGSAAPAPKKK